MNSGYWTQDSSVGSSLEALRGLLLCAVEIQSIYQKEHAKSLCAQFSRLTPAYHCGQELSCITLPEPDVLQRGNLQKGGGLRLPLGTEFMTQCGHTEVEIKKVY
jgi:hypothetical protein